MNAWMQPTVVHNELNRGMGRRGAYPFKLSDVVIEKLELIRVSFYQSSRSR